MYCSPNHDKKDLTIKTRKTNKRNRKLEAKWKRINKIKNNINRKSYKVFNQNSAAVEKKKPEELENRIDVIREDMAKQQEIFK